MASRSIPLCLPDNCSWTESTNEYEKRGDSRSTLKVVNAALRKLRSIQGRVCVVAIAGPCRKGKSYILSKLFTEETIFPLGHLMDPETMGLWMYVVQEKFKDDDGEEFTVVLIDSEGTDSVLSMRRDDNVIFTLTVLLSNILIYNSSSVPKRSDLEALDHVLKLCQRIQVFSGKMTTPKQAQMAFPSFIWLLRDVMLHLPKDCRDINDYFRKKIFSGAGTANAGDKAQKVADTILKCFPSFKAFALPLPSFDPEVVQNLSAESNRGSVNQKFVEGVEEFKGVVKGKLQPKKTPDGKGFLTGEALASMVETYVQTLNTPGAVPSIAGAWEMFIAQKGDELFNIAKTFYYHEMTDDIAWRLPCDSAKIREINTKILDHVIRSVFGTEAKDIPDEKLQQYISELTAEAEDTESSWLRENTHLTEQNCDSLIKELKENYLTPMKSMWEEGDQGIAEKRIRSAHEEVMRRFKRECRGCGELIKNYAMLYKKELDQEMREEIKLVRQMGTKRDEITAYKIMIEEQEYAKRQNEEENTRIRKRITDIDKKMQDLVVENQEEQNALFDEMTKRLQEQKNELESQIRENQMKARMDMEGIDSMTETLAKHEQELRRVIEERDETIRRLRQRHR